MVTTERPAISFTAVMQARVASPSIWTVQAPHNATPQPYFVPMSPSSSRRYQSSGIDGSPSNDRSWPLTRNLTMGHPPRVKLIVVILSPKRWPSNIVNRSGHRAESPRLPTPSERDAYAGVDGQWRAQHLGAMIGQRDRQPCIRDIVRVKKCSKECISL